MARLSAEQMRDIEGSRAKLGTRDIEAIAGMRHAMEIDSSSDKPELESNTFHSDSKHLIRGAGIVVRVLDIADPHARARVADSGALNSDSELRFTS